MGGLAAEFSGSDFASGALGAVVAETVAELYLEVAKSNLEDDNTPFLEECADEIEEYKAEHGGRPLTGLEVNACCKAVTQRLVDRAGLTGKLGAIVTSFGAGQDVQGANVAAVNAIDNNNAMLLARAAGIAFLGVVSGGMFSASTQTYNSYKASLGDDPASQALFDKFVDDPDAANALLKGRDKHQSNDDDDGERYPVHENAEKERIWNAPVEEDGGRFSISGLIIANLQLARTIAILAMSYRELNPMGMILMNEGKSASSKAKGAAPTAKGAAPAMPSPSSNNDDDKSEKQTSHEKGQKKTKTENQAQQEIKRGQAPRGIKRLDKATQDTGEQSHIHFDDGTALNKDGNWRHGKGNPTNDQIRWLKEIGWKI